MIRWGLSRRRFSSCRSGASLFPLTQTPTTFSETGYNTPVTGHIYTSTFAEAIYDTSATSITINSDNDLYTAFPALTEIGLYVNNVFQTVLPGGLGAKSNVVALSAGAKRIRLVNGLQSLTGGSVKGTYLVSISANAGLAPITKTTANRLLIYGDSIIVGDGSTSPTGQAWPMLVRAITTNSVAAEGWGSRRLYDDASDSTKRAAFVSLVQSYNPTTLYMECVHNDWFLGGWVTPTAFGTGLGAVLDALHAAMPSLAIYLQGALFRNPDFTSTEGYTLANFRAQQVSVAGARGWVNYVDALPWVDSFSLNDAVHPNIDGHFGIAQYVKYALGIVTTPTSGAITTNSGAAIAVTTRPENGMWRITKASGISAFDAGATSAGYTGDVYLKLIRRQTAQDVIAGLNASDPTVSNSYTDIDYSFYFAAGENDIWENGVQQGAAVSGGISTPWWIIRVGTTLTYRRGFDPTTATVLRTVTGVSATLYFDCSLFQVTSYVDAAIYAAAP